jgi:hypothetical protein
VLRPKNVVVDGIERGGCEGYRWWCVEVVLLCHFEVKYEDKIDEMRHYWRRKMNGDRCGGIPPIVTLHTFDHHMKLCLNIGKKKCCKVEAVSDLFRSGKVQE